MAKQSACNNPIKAFVAKWKNRGREDQDTQVFWTELVEQLYGVKSGIDYFEWQKPTTVELYTEDDKATKKHIDCYVRNSHCVIEQKRRDIPLDKKIEQSDGAKLDALQQAERYYNSLNQPEQGRYIIACNFKDFKIYDTHDKHGAVEFFHLEDLPRKWRLLRAPLGIESSVLSEQKKEFATKSASEFVCRLYKALLEQYSEKERKRPEVLHALNVFCVRIVFCLYAEAEGLFENNQFRSFIHHFSGRHLQEKFGALFYALNTYEDKREEHLDSVIKPFKRVNGGLFADQKVKVPRINEEIRGLIVQGMDGFEDSDGTVFQWSDISPTNFGCIFESTLDPATRSGNGMHYTSPDNIHRVIDPLFLDKLQKELDDILALPNDGDTSTRTNKLMKFRQKLGKLRFLDPACGSGNFLTETFKSLRTLELRAIKEMPYNGQDFSELPLDYGSNSYIYKVNLNQFYGIEINDFATQVAMAALWITDCQTTKRLEWTINRNCDYLPLKHNNNIHCADALTTEWTEVVRPSALDYIIGNPPFLGSQNMTDSQKEGVKRAMSARNENGKKIWSNEGEMDFVCAWYAKAAEYMKHNTHIAAAFVSTNSIAQGRSVSLLWQPLAEQYKAKILFAWKSFVWDNEADETAHVHCVIEAFRLNCRTSGCFIYEEDRETVLCREINGYLMPAEQVFVASRRKHVQGDILPAMRFGSMPNDTVEMADRESGEIKTVPQLRLTATERSALIKKHPELEPYLPRIYGSEEYINGQEAYCIWITDKTPSEIRNHPALQKRFQRVREKRQESTRPETRELARTPYMFGEVRQPATDYLLVPGTSSENRDYIPMGYCTPDIICSNAALTIESCPLWLFGILSSRLHTAWVKAVAGRLKSDYRYSASVVYNNFLLPLTATDKLKVIEATAQHILDCRKNHSAETLATLYNPLTMPSDLAKAHRLNDRAVFALYSSFGIDAEMNDEQVALTLMRKLAKEAKKNRPKKKRIRQKK